MNIRVTVLLVLFAAPTLAQETPKPKPSPLVAGIWCALKDRAPEPTGEEEGERPGDIGCDVGLGLALHRYKRLSVVAVLGAKSTGAGLAWVPYRGEGPIIAVAVGVVLPYDGQGIYTKPELALGATLSFIRKQE